MNASVGEPYTLATYPLPKAPRENQVSCVPCTSKTSAHPYAVVTVQGDGIHILNTADVHSVISITLGPKTFFSCPSAALVNVEECTTFAVIQSSPDVSKEEAGRVLWAWSHNISSGAETKSREVKVFRLPIHCVHCPIELRGGLLIVTADGGITVLNSELHSKFSIARSSSHASDEQLLTSFVYPSAECAFGYSDSNTEESLVVLVFNSKIGITVSIIVARPDEAVELGSASWQCSEAISDISLNSAGLLSVLSSSGLWHRLQIKASHGVVSLSEPWNEVTLAGLSFAPSEVSITNATTSHALIVGTTVTGQAELAVLLWDLRYSVVVASQVVPIPSSFSITDEKVHPSVSLAKTPSLQAYIALSVVSSTKGPRSGILAVSLSVPTASTIASVMGLSTSSKRWTKQDAVDSSSPSSSPLIGQMRRAMQQSRIETADNVFFNRPKSFELCYNAVKEILYIVLQPEKQGVTPYSPKVVRYLLENRLVTANMIEPSLLKVLSLRNDWPSSILAIRNIKDIPEADLIALIHTMLGQHQPLADTNDRMDVDAGQVPEASFVPVLKICVSYPTSPPALRLALRQHLRDASEVVAVLDVLCDWLEVCHNTDVPLVTRTEVHNNGDGQRLMPAQGDHGTAAGNLPSLPDILSFSQSLLDASFVTLLQHPPAHRVLRRFARHLEPELAVVETLEVLRAPLEPFARAQLKAVQEASDATRGIKKAESKQNDWRKRRKQAHEKMELSVGLYQIEELML